MIQQYKIDKHRGVPSSVSEAQFALACSIHSVKLPERRKRVRAVLKQFGLVKADKLGLYRCHNEEKTFRFTSISAVGMLNCVTLFRFPSSRITIQSRSSDLSAPSGSDSDIGISSWKRTSTKFPIVCRGVAYQSNSRIESGKPSSRKLRGRMAKNRHYHSLSQNAGQTKAAPR